ncbi:MAG: YbjQ family protein [Eubacteriales bacterium]|nr:YbjQ family protein [Bacillota bacterium]MBV1726411.1 YbjQ family protein [Desulforudis sp.]MDQ7788678.1 YbjQ family protein [Clostridia bacterium]MDZ4043621.1 YbjQ family protein [Eubacteriales bacterium]MBU4532205.1 YbjQ family protein [Bacillota bacterium]
MIISTTAEIGGKRVVKTLGLVAGNTVRSRNIGRDILAGLKNIVGGEIKEYTQLMASSRRDAIQRMILEAENMGANAVVEVRFVTAAVASTAAEIVAYGTAVVVE